MRMKKTGQQALTYAALSDEQDGARERGKALREGEGLYHRRR